VSRTGRIILLGYVASFLSGGACLLVAILAIALGSAPERAGLLIWAAVILFLVGFAFKLFGHFYFRTVEGRRG